MFGFGKRRTRQEARPPIEDFEAELADALRVESESNPEADENVRIVRAAIRVAEDALDDAVPALQITRSTPGPVVIRDALEEFERRSAATARHVAALSFARKIAQRLELEDDLGRLHDEYLEERMLGAAREDAKADTSRLPFEDRLLTAAQARAVSLQQVARSAQSPESSVPDVPAAVRANAAIRVARRLEDQILGPR